MADEALFCRLSDFIAAQIGLHFPPERWRDLERGISSAAREFGFADAGACAQWLLASPLTRSQVEVLASHLTVGETYFFRDKKTFEILEEHVFPELIRSRRGGEQRLRIWSAGCATGEEPYSIAILLHKLIPDWERWHIRILATDINPRFLQKGSEGEYGDWSFRDTPSWVREQYFNKTKNGRCRILPAIQKRVSFFHLNLAEDAYPSLSNDTNAIDMIFCRNVLMYFAPERRKKVADNFHRSLVEGGWVIVSPSEASHVLFSKFATVNCPSAILYQKGSDTAFSIDIPPSYFDPKLTSQLPTTTFLEPELAPAAFPQSCGVLLTPREESQKDVLSGPYQEALTLYQLGDYSRAVEKLTIWLSQNESDSNTKELLARVYANLGQLTEALEWCGRAIAADKVNVGCHYLRAMILQEQGAVEEAKTSLKRTLYLDPNFVMAHFGLGNLALRQGKTREAGKHFENALALLRICRQEDTLPESDGITAGRLMEVIRSTGQPIDPTLFPPRGRIWCR